MSVTVLQIYFRAADANIFKLPRYILQTTLAQHRKIKHENMDVRFHITHHFFNFSLRVNSINCDLKYLQLPIEKKYQMKEE